MDYKQKLGDDFRELFTEELKSNKDFETDLLKALIDLKWYHKNDNSNTGYGYSSRDAETLIASMLDYAGYKIPNSWTPAPGILLMNGDIPDAMAAKGWQCKFEPDLPEFPTPEMWEAFLLPEIEFQDEEMDIKQKSIEQIIEHHKNLGYKTDEKGYTSTNQENLIEIYTNWNEVQRELNNGDGNELKPDSHNRVKFRAVHSSCALCVNNFALIKQHKNNVSLFGESGFTEAGFEKKFPTFLRNPVNLDFYLENDNSRIGIESKFTEILKPALPKEKNLEAYIDHKRLPKELQENFNESIKLYLACKEKMYLDVAQLIKHSIALSLYAVENPGKTTKLIYLYWLPLNYKDIKIYQKHENELWVFETFPKIFKLQFESYSYFELWDMMEKNAVLSGILKKIKDRYEFNLKSIVP